MTTRSSPYSFVLTHPIKSIGEQFPAMRILTALLLALLLVSAGCLTPTYTTFAPLDARLEAVPGGGAQYLVLINTSEYELRNYSFSLYVWREAGSRPLLSERPIVRGMASGRAWLPGQGMRWSGGAGRAESAILQPVSRVEIAGHCDEGDFRQAWHKTDSDQLRPVPPSGWEKNFQSLDAPSMSPAPP